MAERRRLLVIDDDEAQVRLLAKVVGARFASRVELTAMTNADAARRWIDEFQPDVVITDLEMPGVSGLEILRAARRRNPAAQVLLLTGHSSAEALLDALEFGATDYLLKPLDVEALVELFRQALDRIDRWRSALTDTIRARNDRTGAMARSLPA